MSHAISHCAEELIYHFQPIWQKKKKAIIIVKTRDNEFLKWAIRATLFPPHDGKDLQRPSKYPVNDSINYGGIDFPTPVKQIDKLEAQNKKNWQ